MDAAGSAVLEGRRDGDSASRPGGEADTGMKRLAKIIGMVLIAIGAVLVLAGLNIVHGLPINGRYGLGWGGWAVAIGAGFLVWSHNGRFRA
jgi:predicted cobalt transporter CbtA